MPQAIDPRAVKAPTYHVKYLKKDESIENDN